MKKSVNATIDTLIRWKSIYSLIGYTEDLEIINSTIDILKNYVSKYSFYLYGSRVKGGFDKTSDLDVLIKGDEEILLRELSILKEKFDESHLPYVVNFSDYTTMDKKFYDLIKDDLIKVELM